MNEYSHRGIPRKPSIGLVFLLIAVCVAVGVALALEYKNIGFIIITQLLQPGEKGVILLPESPATALLFPLKLFVIGCMAVASTTIAAWFFSGGRPRFLGVAAALLVCSCIVSAAVFFCYRQYMQMEGSDLHVNGRPVPSMTRGQLTSVGEVPIFLLGVSGPAFVVAVVIFRMRRKKSSGI